MSTEFGMALCSLISVIALLFELGALKIKVTDLESEIKLLHALCESQEKYIDTLAKHVEQNTYNIRQLSESCSQIDDLDTKAKINQKDIEHALEAIEELKAKRSMDILDKLREEDKE